MLAVHHFPINIVYKLKHCFNSTPGKCPYKAFEWEAKHVWFMLEGLSDVILICNNFIIIQVNIAIITTNQTHIKMVARHKILVAIKKPWKVLPSTTWLLVSYHDSRLRNSCSTVLTRLTCNARWPKNCRYIICIMAKILERFPKSMVKLLYHD